MAKIRSEGELLTLFVEHLRDAGSCITHLATIRQDIGYLAIAELIKRVEQQALRLAKAKQRSAAIRTAIPEHLFN
jgi:hypothetical protein